MSQTPAEPVFTPGSTGLGFDDVFELYTSGVDLFGSSGVDMGSADSELDLFGSSGVDMGSADSEQSIPLDSDSKQGRATKSLSNEQSSLLEGDSFKQDMTTKSASNEESISLDRDSNQGIPSVSKRKKCELWGDDGLDKDFETFFGNEICEPRKKKVQSPIIHKVLLVEFDSSSRLFYFKKFNSNPIR